MTEIEGKSFPRRQRTTRIDNVRRWTVGRLPAAPGGKCLTDYDRWVQERHCSNMSTVVQGLWLAKRGGGGEGEREKEGER